ncbi:mediator of RNA polymerase II transcription subunit 10b-like [Wolffia australiana]
MNSSKSTQSNEDDDSKQNLNQITNSIQKTIGLLHELHLTVTSFNAASQLPLLQRLNALVAECGTMRTLAGNCNFQIPMEVINLIHYLFTKDVFNSCIAKNQITKSKMDAFKIADVSAKLLDPTEGLFFP